MKFLFAVFLLFSVAVQEPPEYPPGHICVYQSDVKSSNDHPCDCHRECKESIDEDSGSKSYYVQEDPQCKQYCHKDHCKCPLKNCD
jgi:hypothetical protein